MIASTLRFSLSRDGYAVIPDLIDGPTVNALLAALPSDDAPVATYARARRGRVYAIRNLFDRCPAVLTLARSTALRGVVETVLSPTARPVRALLFDKVVGANWVVPWHQDLSIAVRGRREVPGYGPWSTKAGVTHVQPPARVLERMITIRVHLDDCDESNGPLRVIPGSHANGPMSSATLAGLPTDRAVSCVVPRGGAVVMRPMIAHASSPARVPGHRRVVHIEYADTDLKGGLEWAIA